MFRCTPITFSQSKVTKIIKVTNSIKSVDQNLISTADDKIQSTERCELYQLLCIQYRTVVGLVAVYTVWTVL